MIAKMKADGFRCSFCGKARTEVASIIAGTPQRMPGVPVKMIGKSAFICNECVRHYHESGLGDNLSTRPASVGSKDLTL